MSQTPGSVWKTLSSVGVAPPTAEQLARRNSLIFAFFAAQAFVVIFLQKFGYSPSQLSVLQACLPFMYVGLALLAAFTAPALDLKRAGLFLVFAAAATISTALQVRTYSVNGFILALVAYLPFVVRFDVTLPVYKRCVNAFLNMMVVGAVLALAEHAVQFLWSWKLWPDLDTLTPTQLLVPGYVYIQPIQYGSAYMKPNGVFFLEVSFLSQFTAIALALEYVYFRRLWRLLLYVSVLFVCFAGTGLLLLLAAAPVLFGRVSIRNMATLLIIAAVVLGVTYEVGWYQQVHHRFNEFQRAGSSANHRFIEPLGYLIEFAKTPGSIFTGIGPGNITKALGYQWWPITKVSVEYGYLSGLAFYLFFLFSIFNTAPDKRIAFVFALWFSFESGFAVPLNAIMCMLFCTMFRIIGTDGLPVGAARKGGPVRVPPPARRPPPRRPIEA